LIVATIGSLVNIEINPIFFVLSFFAIMVWIGIKKGGTFFAFYDWSLE
jgi:hypothetical protein